MPDHDNPYRTQTGRRTGPSGTCPASRTGPGAVCPGGHPRSHRPGRRRPKSTAHTRGPHGPRVPWMLFNWPSLSGSTRHRPLITSCVPTRGSARPPFWKGLPSSIPSYPDKRNRAMPRAGLLCSMIRPCPRVLPNAICSLPLWPGCLSGSHFTTFRAHTDAGIRPVVVVSRD